jgi:predicted transposase
MGLSIADGKNLSEEKANKLYITLECMLEFEKEEEKERVLALMRRFSSATRYAYKRLLEGIAEKEIEKRVAEKHKLNTRYVKDAVLIAKGMLKSCIQRGQNPKKLVFGSRELFEKLKKMHLTGKRRERLRQRWEERRYYYLHSRGERPCAHTQHPPSGAYKQLHREGILFQGRVSSAYRRTLYCPCPQGKGKSSG